MKNGPELAKYLTNALLTGLAMTETETSPRAAGRGAAAMGNAMDGDGCCGDRDNERNYDPPMKGQGQSSSHLSLLERVF